MSGKVSAVDSLLKAKVENIDQRNKDDATALHIAVENNHFAVAEQLLQAGADIFAINGAGLTPYEIAHQRKYKRLANSLHRIGKSYASSNNGRHSSELSSDENTRVASQS